MVVSSHTRIPTGHNNSHVCEAKCEERKASTSVGVGGVGVKEIGCIAPTNPIATNNTGNWERNLEPNLTGTCMLWISRSDFPSNIEQLNLWLYLMWSKWSEVDACNCKPWCMQTIATSKFLMKINSCHAWHS